MKKIIAVLVLFLTTINLMAQEHLSIKSIPIEGSMSEFCNKLKAKDFTHISNEGNISIFMGDFTGREALVGVKSTDNGANVYSVIVTFEPSEEWNTLVNTYSYYKELYTRKYGKPTTCKEHNPTHLNSNTALMGELYNGTVTWSCIWKVPGGDIGLQINKSTGFYEGMVNIIYEDAQNVEAKIQNDLEEI